MTDQHPRCPQCGGLLKHEPADILGPERVHCILCGWELARSVAPVKPPQKHEETTLKPEPDWVPAALSVKTLLKKTVSERGLTMTATNTLSTLNDHLFNQLARLAASDATGEKLKEEIERTRAMSGLAKEMIDNAKLALEVQRCLGGKPDTPPMLQVEAPK